MSDEVKQLISGFPTLNKQEVDAITKSIVAREFKKGTILLKEGQVSKECYSVLKGCVRQYHLDEGEEKTTALFTEGDAVVPFRSYIDDLPSKHYLVCVENCTLTVGNKEKESQICQEFPILKDIIREELEKNMAKAQEQYAFFVSSSPEKRYLNLIENRPDLVNRVPLHQIASYLGIKPESLSRIRKRITIKE